jgi:hypothetical protein
MPKSPVHRESTVIIDTGCPVFTNDGKQLGDVAEVRDRWFRVTGDHPDYWLDMERVTAASDERVDLDFDSSEVAQHRLAKPGSSDQPDTTMATGDRLDGHHAASAGSADSALERNT